MTTPPVSPTADRLGDLIAPKVRLGVDAMYADIQSEGNLIERLVAHKAYPIVVRKIPQGSKVVCHHALTSMGKMTISDLASMLVEHAKASGEAVHPTVAAAQL